jgi:hypothetical protein
MIDYILEVARDKDISKIFATVLRENKHMVSVRQGVGCSETVNTINLTAVLCYYALVIYFLQTEMLQHRGFIFKLDEDDPNVFEAHLELSDSMPFIASDLPFRPD